MKNERLPEWWRRDSCAALWGKALGETHRARARAEDDHNKMYTNICLARVLFMCLAMIVCRFLCSTHTSARARARVPSKRRIRWGLSGCCGGEMYFVLANNHFMPQLSSANPGANTQREMRTLGLWPLTKQTPLQRMRVSDRQQCPRIS